MRSWCGCFVALAVVVTLSSVPAAAQSDMVETYMTAASRLYENLEYERALEQLQRAKKVSRGMEDDVAIALYEGIILGDMGKKDDSTAAFKEALYLNVDAKLPVKVSPKVQRDFEEVRAQVKKELAPILAKREAEKRAKEEADAAAAKKAADQKAQADAAAAKKAQADADAARKAAEDKARADAAAKKAAEDKARVQSQGSGGQQQVATATDVPTRETHVTTVVPADNGTQTPGGLGSETGVSKAGPGVPVVPIVLGGVAVAAAGVGAYFGLQARSEIDAAQHGFQNDAQVHLDNAKGPALTANVAFAAAGTAALGAIISYFVTSGGEAAPAATPSTSTGAASAAGSAY